MRPNRLHGGDFGWLFSDIPMNAKLVYGLVVVGLLASACAPMSTVAEPAADSPTNPRPENTIGPMPSAVPTGNEIGPSPLPSFTPESIIPATPIAEVPSFIMDAVDESVRAYPLPSMIRGLGDYQVLSENGFAGVTVANGEAYRNSVAYPMSMTGPDGSVYQLDKETNEDNLKKGFVAYKGKLGYLVFVNGMPVEDGVTHLAATDPNNQGEVVVLKVKNGEVVGEDRNRVLEVESLNSVLFDSDGAVFVIQGEKVLELKVGAREDVATPEPTATDTPEPTATTAATATVAPTQTKEPTVVFEAPPASATPEPPPVVGGIPPEVMAMALPYLPPLGPGQSYALVLDKPTDGNGDACNDGSGPFPGRIVAVGVQGVPGNVPSFLIKNSGEVCFRGWGTYTP